MCFDVTPANTKVQIAKKDIVVWKIGHLQKNGTFGAQFRVFTYQKGKLYKAKGRCLTKNEYPEWHRLNNGFHSFVKIPKLTYLNVVKFIIPTGARYLRNDFWGEFHDEYISNQIIMP